MKSSKLKKFSGGGFIPLLLLIISFLSLIQWGIIADIESRVKADQFSEENTSYLDLTAKKLLKVDSNLEGRIVDILTNLEEEKLIADQIYKVQAFFINYNSPMQGYEEIIVRKAHECGGDYAILVGIAGNESGLGKIPYKKYNPYGYLDGIEYSGWEESLTKLSCVISQRFIMPCSGDLACIVRKYAGPVDDQELWIRNVSWFINQVR